jgi:hypothetical protein
LHIVDAVENLAIPAIAFEQPIHSVAAGNAGTLPGSQHAACIDRGQRVVERKQLGGGAAGGLESGQARGSILRFTTVQHEDIPY